MLEELLKDLTTELRLLRQAIASGKTPTLVAPTQENVPEQGQAPVEKEPTALELREKIKAMCLSISKTDRNKLPDVRSTLSEFGGKTVDVIAEEKLNDLLARIEALQ